MVGGRNLNSVRAALQNMGLEDIHGVSIPDLISNPNIDGVVIATPPASHMPLAKMALEAGKDVFIEKPMALSVTEAETLHAYSNRNARVLMVGHVLRYHSAFTTLLQWVRERRLGKIVSIHSERISRGRIRDAESVLWSFAPHDVSMILALINDAPINVRAVVRDLNTGSGGDQAHITLEFPEMMRAEIFVSWMGPIKSQRLIVTGTQGVAVFDDVADWPRKLGFQSFTKSETNRVNLGEVEWANLMPMEPLRREAEAFLNAIKTRKKTPSDGSEGVRVVRVLAAAEAAARQV